MPVFLIWKIVFKEHYVRVIFERHNTGDIFDKYFSKSIYVRGAFNISIIYEDYETF